VQAFLQRHADKVTGVLSGFDRLLFRGTIRMLSAPQGIKSYLWHRDVLLTDFARHVVDVTKQLKDAVVGAVEKLGRPVVRLNSASERKDVIAREIAQRDGVKEGVVCLLTAVEPCSSFEVRGNRETKRIDVRRAFRKCLFLYRYEFHPVLGFIHARIQSWFPFSVQVWLNGREWLARQMDDVGLGYQRLGNCFAWLESSERAQQLMNQQLRVSWPKLLDDIIDELNPIRHTMFGKLRGIRLPYYWSVAQSEWATDIIFRDPQALAPLYPRLVQHAITSFGSPDVMRFLGHKVTAEGRVHPAFRGQVVTDLKHRPEGICVKHRVNGNGIKIYDKQACVLRIETTIHQPYDFKVFRRKEGDPRSKQAWHVLRHGVADLQRRSVISQAANERYATALHAVEDAASLGDLIHDMCQPTALAGRRVRALRPWAPDDLALLRAVSSGEFILNGFRSRDLVPLLYPSATADLHDHRRRSSRVSRLIRLLRAHRLIKKVPKTHRYMVSKLGRRAITALLAAHAASTEKLASIAA
jgi:hypothetical protein